MKPETIETPNARLRLVRDDDAADVESACNDSEVRRFLPSLPQPYTRDDALRFVRDGATGAWATGGGIYAIADPATDRLLGTIGVHHVDADRAQGEIGYWVAPWARGKRVATTATKALGAHVFADGFDRLELLARAPAGARRATPTAPAAMSRSSPGWSVTPTSRSSACCPTCPAVSSPTEC
jgi:RimJ/RimL family protein N-acetyltransferase